MTEPLTPSDLVLVAQEMTAASQKYATSADNLRRMEQFHGQFRNAINGQRQMADWCAAVARKARAATDVMVEA